MRKTGGYVCALLMAGLLSAGQAQAANKIQNFNTEFQPGELIVKFAPHFGHQSQFGSSRRTYYPFGH